MKELKYYGVHACLSIWKQRPEEIIRVYVHESNVKLFSPLLKWCAQKKKAYRILPTEDLNKVSDSIHHEGVCIVAKELPPLSPESFLASLKKSQGKTCLLYLDGVQNPHNLGSILRTSAHFGIPYILGEVPPLSPSACRIAKGAAEIVRLVPLPKPSPTLQALIKMGFTPIAASPHEGKSLYQFSFPPRTLLVFGSESFGIESAHFKSIPKIQIPGTGLLESLNVSVAAALCIGEYARQHFYAK